MAEFLECFPSTIVYLINNPLTNVFVGMLGSIFTCLTLLWYYYPNKIAPVLVASGFSDKLSSVEFLNACLVTVTICGLLLLDLLLDFWSSLNDYRSRLHERKRRALLLKPENNATESEKATEIIEYDFKEIFTRLMYITCVLVASISVWVGRPEYRCILGYFAVRFRNITMFTICIYSTVDTFRMKYKWIFLLGSVMYASTANWGLILRLNGGEASLLKTLAFVGQTVPIVTACLLFIYLWVLMFLRARSAYKKREATLFSVKEWTFLVYSATTFCSASIIFLTSMDYGFQLDQSPLNHLLLRESMIIISAITWAILPTRIARARAKLLMSRWINAKRDVTSLLNSPLKMATFELNGLMEDDDAEGPHHPDGYVSISRQRLARVASACNSTIMKLTSIAEEKEMDHLGDDDDSSINCNFQDFGRTSSDHFPLSSTNISSSWGGGADGSHRNRHHSNRYRSSDHVGMDGPGQHELFYDDVISGSGDVSSHEGRGDMIRPHSRPPSRSHRHDARDGTGDVTSHYENSSQQSHSQMSGGFVGSLSLWSAQFSNLSSISRSVDGDVRTRFTHRAMTILGRKTKASAEEMVEIPTHPHEVVERGGGERVDHNDNTVVVDGGGGMVMMMNNVSKDDASTNGVVFDGVVVSLPFPQQQVV